MINKNDNLHIDYYNGIDGPTILIYGSSNANYISLQNIFEHSNEWPDRSIQLEHLPFIVSHNGTSIKLQVYNIKAEKRLRGTHGFRRISNISAPCFEWCLTDEEWRDLAAMIDGIVHVDTGHQYLLSAPGMDAVIILSKGGGWRKETGSGEL